ncbi:MAG: (Fe-S)-binding protein [Rhodospirillales bacterium]|nr:(Fe-S)-binding protein [Rhodospirillales bacterium]
MSEKPHDIGLFVTCLADLFRPSVAFAAVKLLEDAGCTVSVPKGQTCCGQPAYNSGDRDGARTLARQTIESFERFEYVVLPSGSCAGMIAKHYPDLFEDDPAWRKRAEAVAAKTHELTSFLVDVLKVEKVAAALPVTATYHDSCSGLRELGIKKQPRALLASVEGLNLTEATKAEECCGFGGTFCVKYPEVSTHIASGKTADFAETGASVLLGGDLGCLMNLAGRAKREGRDITVRHVAEVLAGMIDTPGIGDGEDEA